MMFGRLTRAEVEGMIAAAVADERARHEAELQAFADQVNEGFARAGKLFDRVARIFAEHEGYLTDLMTVAVAEEIRAGRLDPAAVQGGRLPRRQRPRPRR